MKQPLGSFFREVWRTERQLPGDKAGYHRVGHDGWPERELVRFRSGQHMGFAGQDVVDRKVRRLPNGMQQAELTVDTMGLTGARGALPSHYSEIVLAQLKQKAPAMRDFFDLFNHRLLSLYYRSWEKTQPAVHQERQGEDDFSRILKALSGSEQQWEVWYGGALSRGARSASTLRSVLADVAGMPVRVRTMQGGWARVSKDDQTRLPDRRTPEGRYARLGDAMVGSRAWLADRGVDVVFYPGSRHQVQDVLPRGRCSAAVARMAGRLAGGQLRVRYLLVARARDLTATCLGQQGRLGADSFIAAGPTSDRQVEVSFKPSQAKERKKRDVCNDTEVTG